MVTNLNETKQTMKLFRCIPARVSLHLLCLSGFAVTSMLRSATMFTLLVMVKDQPFQAIIEPNNTNKLCYKGDANSTVTTIDYGGTLEWSLEVQYYFLTSFFWSYLITQVVGGVAVQYYGTKVVFGGGLLISSLCNLCIPYSSNVHYAFAITFQCLQGAAQGVTWPSIYAIVSSWVPMHERSRFLTCFQGILIGNIIGQVASGYIIVHIGWEYVYYISGCISTLWCLIWFLLVHNVPEVHPRISAQELKYITENRERSSCRTTKIPWKKVILSTPVWAIAITSFGRMWLTGTLIVYGPLYLKTVIGLNAKMNGLFFGAASFFSLIAQFLFSYAADKLVKRKTLPLLTNRKLFTGIGTVIPGFLVVALNYLNCNLVLILINWCLIQIFLASSFSGAMVNIVDISPSFTGPVSSLIQIVLMSGPILASLVAKSFLKSNNPTIAWSNIFNISAGVLIATFAFYSIFASEKVQSWDNKAASNGNDMDKDLDVELKELNRKDNVSNC